MWIVLFRPSLIERICRSRDNHALCESDPEGFYCRQLGRHQSEELSAQLEKVRCYEPDPALYNAALVREPLEGLDAAFHCAFIVVGDSRSSSE